MPPSEDMAVGFRALQDLGEEQQQIREQKSNIMQREKRNRDAIKTTSLSCAKAWNSDFSKLLFDYLPRELRNMVYWELAMDSNDPNHKSITVWEELGRFGLYGDDYQFRRVDKKTYNHYFQVEFMGMDFVSELSEVFYASRVFALPHHGAIQDFFYKDIFGTECVPWKHFRRLMLCLAESFFWVESEGHAFEWPQKRYFAGPSPSTVAISHLQLLEDLECRPGSSLFIHQRFRNKDLDDYLASFTQRMEEKGWTVRIDTLYFGPVLSSV